ncbi:ABC transporter substrate-binding protein [uncultured Sphaerochaeta sp.]|uniref:ABC transporter substrate-binding protein n=1 Tax=uncultured Sphaerochaeta sp. TaxID=886478 RepID=UPI002A0A9D04|nr:ABC transporter substrate-binding protein [uncultured Sphaerochaeta sp.]
MMKKVGVLVLVMCIALGSAFANGEQESKEGKLAVTYNGELQNGEYVIGLSNSYFGNTWRKQMVEAFSKAAEEAKSAGYISRYEIQNGDGTVNSQIAQINSFILSGVDAIAICAASPTALNSTIQKALDKGIKVVAFDSIVNLKGVYTMDYPWEQIGMDSTDFVAQQLNGKGNVVVVRGVSGAAPDKGIYAGIKQAIQKYPDLKIVQEVIGEASATKTQEELIKVLPSLPEINAVITHCGGDAIGAVNAFEQSGRAIPIIIGDNTAEYINWWENQKGYTTLSQGSTPGCGGAAFWTSLYILNGFDVPQSMMLGVPHVTVDNLSDYSGMKAGTFISPNFSKEYVLKEIIEAAK